MLYYPVVKWFNFEYTFLKLPFFQLVQRRSSVKWLAVVLGSCPSAASCQSGSVGQVELWLNANFDHPLLINLNTLTLYSSSLIVIVVLFDIFWVCLFGQYLFQTLVVRLKITDYLFKASVFCCDTAASLFVYCMHVL